MAQGSASRLAPKPRGGDDDDDGPVLEQEVEAFDCNAFLEKLFSPRRKLRPRVRARKPEPGSNEVPRKVEIVVVEIPEIL